MEMLIVLGLAALLFFHFIGWWAVIAVFLYWVVLQTILAGANFVARR